MSKEPVLLVVLVDPQRLRWLVAGIDERQAVTPLVRSADGDLAGNLGLPFDEQVSFLRHRFCGVLQRGFDRLWARNQKPACFVFLFSGSLDGPSPGLTQRVADHMVDWMTNPPIGLWLIGQDAATSLTLLAGTIPEPWRQTLEASLGPLYSVVADEPAWALAPGVQG